MRARIRSFRTRAVAVASVALLVLAGSALIAVSADTVTATIPVGDSPGALAVDPLSHRVYCANYLGASVSVIDGASSSVVATVPAGFGLVYPAAVAVDHLATPARAFVGNFWNGNLIAIDSSTYASSTVLVGAAHGGGPRALVVDASSSPHRLFIASYGRGVVEVRNAETLALLSTLVVQANPRAMAYYPGAKNTSRLYVVNRGSSSVSVIDARNYTVVGHVPVAAGARSVAIDPGNGFAYVTSDASNLVTVIQPDASVLATVSVGTAPQAVAVDGTRDRVFVANSGSGDITVISTVTNARAATVTVGAQPVAVALDESAGKAYIANRSAGTVSVIDAALASADVSVGGQPVGVVVDTASSPHLAYVSNAASDTVSVIAEQSGQAALSVSRAVADDPPPVALTLDPVPPLSGQDVLVTGQAESRRTPLTLDIAAVLWREAGTTDWKRAGLVVDPDTGNGSFSFSYGAGASVGAHTIEVIALDALGAVSVSSDNGIGALTPEVGARATAQVTVIDTSVRVWGRGWYGSPRQRVSFEVSAAYPPGSAVPEGRFTATLPGGVELRADHFDTLALDDGAARLTGAGSLSGRSCTFEFAAKEGGRGAAMLRVRDAATGELLRDYSNAGALVTLSGGRVYVTSGSATAFGPPRRLHRFSR